MAVTDADSTSGEAINIRNTDSDNPEQSRDVTDSDSKSENGVSNGNTTKLATLETQLDALLYAGMSPEEREEAKAKNRAAAHRHLEALRTARACEECGKPFGPEDPVCKIRRLRRTLLGGHSYHMVVVCHACLQSWPEGITANRLRHAIDLYKSGTPMDDAKRTALISQLILGECRGCGREVIQEERKHGADDGGLNHIFCCERCKWTYFNRIRNNRNAAAREKVCEVCGEPFTASRRDAKTCSKACKQKAYRRRKAKTRVIHVNSGEHFDVYIGRAVPRTGLKRSDWHNPFNEGRDGTREEVIAKFERYLFEERPDLVERLSELKGKVLGCWCKPEPCHGDVLVRLIEDGAGEEDRP